MSLPAGVINRPFVTTHPRVLGRVLRLTLLSLFVLSPLLLYVVVQIQGVRSRYECSRIEKDIQDLQLERRRLMAERARLIAPERLRVEAERLGLVPAPLADRPGAPIKPRPAPEPDVEDGAPEDTAGPVGANP